MDFVCFFRGLVAIWLCLRGLFAAWGVGRDGPWGCFDFAPNGNAATKGWGFSGKARVDAGGAFPFPGATENGSRKREPPMPPTAATVSPVPEKFGGGWRVRPETEMRSRKYSPRTVGINVHYNRRLCRAMQKSPDGLNRDDVKRFLAAMEKDGYSASAMNIALSAAKFFFRNVLKDDGVKWQRRPRQDRTLPSVLSKGEIKRIFDAGGNPRNRLLLMLVYSAGLRAGEAVAVKRGHVDIDRKIVFVRAGKGRKDRCTVLSEKAVPIFKEYCECNGIQKWLFPGKPSGRHLSIRYAQQIFYKAAQKAGIPKKTSIHGLRHTFATHLLENGTDIRCIQALLGHSSVRTTEKYARVALRSALAVKSPLDCFP